MTTLQQPPTLPALSPAEMLYRDWLLELSSLPTAAGREHRAINWIRAWVADRPDLAIKTDRAGNLVIEPRRPWGNKSSKGSNKAADRRPIFITAHLDHPAFVVERIVAPGIVELSFRGGVNDDYFENARIVIHPVEDRPSGREPVGATLISEDHAASDHFPNAGGTPRTNAFGKLYLAELDDTVEIDANSDHSENQLVRVGDVGVWALPPADIDADGIVHTLACDDLSGVAAALSAFDALRHRFQAGEPVQDVRVLLTRAEEIGFIGAIAACKLATMPRGSRVIALENSRSFPDSPIGGGPIVRVGDRLTVFTPWLTAACAKRAEEITGRPAIPTAKEKQPPAGSDASPLTKKLAWQRKLMPGGACEASVYCAFGYDATCLCLPLGNYHNMAHLAQVQDGSYDRDRLGPPRVGREYISLDDYLGLVNLLVAIGTHLPEPTHLSKRFDDLFASKAAVLETDLKNPILKKTTRAKVFASPQRSSKRSKTSASTSKKPRHTNARSSKR